MLLMRREKREKREGKVDDDDEGKEDDDDEIVPECPEPKVYGCDWSNVFATETARRLKWAEVADMAHFGDPNVTCPECTHTFKRLVTRKFENLKTYVICHLG